MGFLLPMLNATAQKINITPYYIGERVADLPLGKLLNYKDTTARFSDFGHKLIILDFWATTCSSCMAMFPLEDSLQRAFEGEVQFLPITGEAQAKVKTFLAKWMGRQGLTLSFPIVTEGKLAIKLFGHYSIPYFIWMAPNGEMLAQTSGTFINRAAINAALAAIREKEEHLRAGHHSRDMFFFPPATEKYNASLSQ